MATAGGPNIETNGLVLKLDAANVKSFRGEPTTNLISNPIVGDYGNSPGSTNNTISPDGSNNATIPIPDANADRYQIAIAGGNHPSGTQFTYSWHYKQLGPHLGTSPNEPGGLLITGLVNCTLVGTATKLYDLNNGWSRWKATFQIVDGSLESIFRLYFGAVIGINGNSAAYYGHQFEQKIYATPFVIGTRGTTVATGGGWGDTSGNNNHGELVNGPIYSSANGGSIVFDGINDYVNSNYTPVINTGGSYSQSVWFRTTNATVGDNGSNRLIEARDNKTGNPLITSTINIFEENTLVFLARGTNGVRRDLIITNINVNDGSWRYFHSQILTNGTTQIYLNGFFVGQNTLGVDTRIDLSGRPLAIGARNLEGNISSYFNGNIAQVQIYNRALSATEIFQNYNATKSRFGL